MKDKVQIIQYTRSLSFPSSYVRASSELKVFPFDTIHIAPPQKESIIKRGAEHVLSTFNESHISGLFPIKRIPNVFYGDIMGAETIGIWIQPDKEIISIAIFIGHRPKLMKAKEKKVINYINAELRAKNKG